MPTACHFCYSVNQCSRLGKRLATQQLRRQCSMRIWAFVCVQSERMKLAALKQNPINFLKMTQRCHAKYHLRIMFKFRTFVYCFDYQHPRKIKRYSYISSALFWVLNSKPYFWISISQSALIIIFFICHIWISLTALHRQVGYNNKFKQAGRQTIRSQTIRRVVTCLLTQPLAIWLAASGIHSQTKIQYVVWLFSF